MINLVPIGKPGKSGLPGPTGPTGLPPADSLLITFSALTENDPKLEGYSFPKTFTFPRLARQTTITKLVGLINTLPSGYYFVISCFSFVMSRICLKKIKLP
jgi:hypothetical protein